MKKYKNIDEFIAGYPKQVQDRLRDIRAVVREEAPEAEEAIAYGIPTFKLYGKNLVHFSALTHHIGFYPTASGVETFKKELSAYKTSKGAIQFPLNHTIPLPLIRKIVKFRVKELKVNRIKK